MITRYTSKALALATYEQLDDGSYCATVPGLRGVIANGTSLESCRDNLIDVIEEWILVRVARGLSIPVLGKIGIKIKRAI